MLVKPELNTNELPGLLATFLDISGEQPWKRRLRWIEQQLRRNPLLLQYMQANHSLEQALPTLRHKVKTLGYAVTIDQGQEYRLAALIAGIVSIYERLPAKARKRLRGSLMDGLTDPEKKGLINLQHEITVAMHLMDQGFDVTFADWEGGGRFDFLASREGAVMEVECKVVTGDLGRKITILQSVEIFDRIVKEISRNRKPTQATILQIVLPGRLERNEQIKRRIAEIGYRAIRSGENFEEPGFGSAVVQHFDHNREQCGIKQGEPFDVPEVRDFFIRKTGIDNPHLFIANPLNHPPLFISVRSQQKDSVLESIIDTLSEAAKSQLTKTRPGVFCVQLHDLTEDQLLELAQDDSTDPRLATGIKLATHHFLAADARSHVLSVVYRSHGKVLQRHLPDGIDATGTRETGIAYGIPNGQHPQYGNPAFRIFTKQTPEDWTDTPLQVIRD